MKLFQTIAAAQNGRLFPLLGQAYGVDANLAAQIVRLFLPAVTKAVARRAETGEGVVTLLQFLGAERYDETLDRPDVFRDSRLAEEGRYILHMLFAHAGQIDKIVANRAKVLPVADTLLADMFPHIALVGVAALQRCSREPLKVILEGLTESVAEPRSIANPYAALADEVELRLQRDRGSKRSLSGVFGTLFGSRERAA